MWTSERYAQADLNSLKYCSLREVILWWSVGSEFVMLNMPHLLLPTSPRMLVSSLQTQGEDMLRSAEGFVCRERNSESGSGGFVVEKMPASPLLDSKFVLHCIVIYWRYLRSKNSGLPTWLQGLVSDLKKYLQLLFWFQLKGVGKFLMWIPIKLWVGLPKWLIRGQ